jgi:hypothetical protein
MLSYSICNLSFTAVYRFVHVRVLDSNWNKYPYHVVDQEKTADED